MWKRIEKLCERKTARVPFVRAIFDDAKATPAVLAFLRTCGWAGCSHWRLGRWRKGRRRARERGEGRARPRTLFLYLLPLFFFYVYFFRRFWGKRENGALLVRFFIRGDHARGITYPRRQRRLKYKNENNSIDYNGEQNNVEPKQNFLGRKAKELVSLRLRGFAMTDYVGLWTGLWSC